MKSYSSDQNGNNRLRSRFRHTRKKARIPLAVLRKFGRRMLTRYTQRGLSKMLKVVSPTAVQDFISGHTEPEYRTKRAFAKLYLFFHPFLGYWEKRKVPKRKVLPQLKSVLPEGEQAALEYVDTLIRVGEASGELPLPAGRLREWLTFLVEAEYDVERRFKEHERKRKPKGSGAGPLKPRRKKKAEDEGEG